MILVREMPVLASARIMEITDTRLWRIVHYYVGRAGEMQNVSVLVAVASDKQPAGAIDA